MPEDDLGFRRFAERTPWKRLVPSVLVERWHPLSADTQPRNRTVELCRADRLTSRRPGTKNQMAQYGCMEATAMAGRIGKSGMGRSQAQRRGKRHDSVHMNVNGFRQRHVSRNNTGSCEVALTFAEFFAGIGLVRVALESQGWRAVFANDICADKAAMYRHNWSVGDHLVVKDIREVTADQLPSCSLFTASFPCNDLSIAGRWEGLDGKKSSAFWGLVKILKEMGDRRPPIVLLENVVGFLMSQEGRDLEKVLIAFNELGYKVDAFILNAIHWVPQSRARLFIVATRDDGVKCQTVATTTDSRPKLLVDFITKHQTVGWNIRDLPNLPTSRKRLVDIIEKLPDDDPLWWSETRSAYLRDQMSVRHEAKLKELMKGAKWNYATVFRRVRNGKTMAELRVDGIAGCLRTPRGGSARQILIAARRGKFRVRLLSARECARLQGVPDDFPIKVSLNKALFGFGDAVCVPVVEWIMRNYINPMIRALVGEPPNRRKKRNTGGKSPVSA